MDADDQDGEDADANLRASASYLRTLRTRYGDDGPIIPGRVEGYVRSAGGVANATFISMTQPYAAGALVSNVDDLALWQAALDGDGFLSAESRRSMRTHPLTARTLVLAFAHKSVR